jgi:hypothetical protein
MLTFIFVPFILKLMSQSNRSGTQTGTAEVSETLYGGYDVFEQGDSRVFTVPSELDCEIGDGIDMRAGEDDGQTVYLCGFVSSLARDEEIAARRAALKQSDAQNETYFDCNDIRSHDPGRIVTIPCDCDEDLFGDKTEHLLFTGTVNGNLYYLKYIPKVNVRLDGAAL